MAKYPANLRLVLEIIYATQAGTIYPFNNHPRGKDIFIRMK